MGGQPRPDLSARLIRLARIGAPLALNLKHQRLLHAGQPLTVEDERSVLVWTGLTQPGQHDVDMGMGRVAMLGRDPAQGAAATVGFESANGRSGQLA